MNWLGGLAAAAGLAVIVAVLLPWSLLVLPLAWWWISHKS